MTYPKGKKYTGDQRIEGLPGWAYPTPEAQRAHYFTGTDQPSACKRYYAGALETFTWLTRRTLTYPDHRALCTTCLRKAGTNTLPTE